jgi:hypothetical protein
MANGLSATVSDLQKRSKEYEVLNKSYREALHAGTLAITAMAGSRAAYSQLLSATTSQDQNIREIASWAVAAIAAENLDILRSQTLNPDLTPEQLSQFSTSPSAMMRTKAVERMGLTKDRRFVPRIIEIIRDDPNLNVLRAALIALTRAANDPVLVLPSDEEGAKTALAWWEKHKSEFK